MKTIVALAVLPLTLVDPPDVAIGALLLAGAVFGAWAWAARPDPRHMRIAGGAMRAWNAALAGRGTP